MEYFTEAVYGWIKGRCETVGVRFRSNQTNEGYESKHEGKARLVASCLFFGRQIDVKD